MNIITSSLKSQSGILKQDEWIKENLLIESVREGLSFATVAETEDLGAEGRE